MRHSLVPLFPLSVVRCYSNVGNRRKGPVFRERTAGTWWWVKDRGPQYYCWSGGWWGREPRRSYCILDPTVFFVVPLEVAGLFCHHIKSLTRSYVTHYLGHCMENPSPSFRNLPSSFLFFQCFWVLTENTLLSARDLWPPVFEDHYLNEDCFPSRNNGERRDLGIVAQVAKIISACLVTSSFEVSRCSQGCMWPHLLVTKLFQMSDYTQHQIRNVLDISL